MRVISKCSMYSTVVSHNSPVVLEFVFDYTGDLKDLSLRYKMFKSEVYKNYGVNVYDSHRALALNYEYNFCVFSHNPAVPEQYKNTVREKIDYTKPLYNEKSKNFRKLEFSLTNKLCEFSR